MQPAVARVVELAVTQARVGTTRAAVASAIVAALRRIRRTVDEQAGFAAARMLDDFIRGHIRSESVKGDLPVRDLPADAVHDARAEAILDDCVSTCIALNAFTPDNGALTTAVGTLLDCLFRQVEGAPDPDGLLARLRSPERMEADPGPRIAMVH
ncbi:MAG TPA: hypothetical protein VF342_09005 [Alphaproteobacteria bacterium]